MSEQQNSAFGKFIPGFDFLQNLAKGASHTLPQMPNLSSWIAPTLNVEELDKRIGELKAVHFWLDQNSTALAATIQALEVQKMTLATLKGMNFNMAEMADALKLKTPESMFSTVPAKSQPVADASHKPASDSPKPGAARKGAAKARDAAQTRVVDPLQWWGALTQQFQQIAANAMQDAAATSEARKAATPAKAAAAPAGTARKTGVRGKKPARKAAAG